MRSRNVRFLITDWIMPEMTGIELIRVVREDPCLFATPILVLTGVCSADGVMCAMEEGADAYVIKPFTANQLLKSISGIVRKKNDPMQPRISEMTRLKLEGKYSQAIQVGAKILEETRNPNVLFSIGECLVKTGQVEAAIKILGEAGQMEKCGKSKNLLGKVLIEQGDQEQGIDYLKTASKQCGLIQKRKVDLAEALFKSGRETEGEAEVEAILKNGPTNLILADIGKLYMEQGNLERAGAFLRESVTPTPETVPMLNNYAIALRRQESYEESEAIYKKCIELVPDSFVLYFNAGMVSAKMKKYTRAKEMMQNALKLNPSYMPAQVFLDTLGSKTG